MSKFCEVCGRPIKTGRKYCYEHRNQGSGVSSMNNLEKMYINSRVPSSKINLFLFSFWFFLYVILFFYEALPSRGFDGGFAFPFSIVAITILMLLLWIYLFRSIKRLIIGKFTSKAINEIVDKNKEFVKFAKSYGDFVKDEKEFRKSIFN